MEANVEGEELAVPEGFTIKTYNDPLQQISFEVERTYESSFVLFWGPKY